MRRVLARDALWLASASLTLGCAASICDPDELRQALNSANVGDTLQLGACSVSGNFSVPAGVTLSGQGVGSTILVGNGDAPTLQVRASGPVTTISGLSIQSSTPGAIDVQAGSVALTDIAIGIEANAYGVRVVDAQLATLDRVEIIGPGAEWPGSTGVHFERAMQARLTTVSISGTSIGARSVDSNLTWTGGTLRQHSHGASIVGGHAQLVGISISDVGDTGLGTAALSGAASAEIDASAMRIERCATPAISVSGDSTLRLREATIIDTFGIVASGARELALEGPDIEIAASQLAGIVICDTEVATVRGIEVRDTVFGTYVLSGSEPPFVRIGDGIVVLQSTNVAIEDVRLSNNARLGLFVGVGDDPATMPRFSDVHVSGAGEQRGAYGVVYVMDGTTRLPPGGWDTGIIREGDTATNDAVGTTLVGFACQPVRE